jgi:hypothetical protein
MTKKLEGKGKSEIGISKLNVAHCPIQKYICLLVLQHKFILSNLFSVA